MTFTYRLIISPFDEPPALTYAIPVVSKKMINIKAETESCSLLIFKTTKAYKEKNNRY